MPEPAISEADAADLCDEHYRTLQDGLKVARKLRVAGYRVYELPFHPVHHPDGLVTVATVYHPDSHESPGDVLVVASAVPIPQQRRADPGG